MKIFTALIAALCSFCLGFVLSADVDTGPWVQDTSNRTGYTAPTATSERTFTPTTPSSQYYNLDNISIQDVLSSDIDASEKIEKKIISAVAQYASNCGTYKKIDLSSGGFTFPESSITVNLGSTNAIFYNIRISESDKESSKRKSYATLIGCDSTGMAKIEVKLLKNLEISANLNVTKITNSSNGFQSPSDILDAGSISLTFKDNSISKQFSPQKDDLDVTTSKISFSKSMVSLDIAKKFQMPIYNKLEIFSDEVEAALSQFLVVKLEEELSKNNISVADSCSKFVNADKNSKKVNLPFFFNNNLNNLYVIPNSTLETWRGVSLSAGPILINGLSSFNSTELFILENEAEKSASGEFSTTPKPDDPEMKEMTVRVKTNELKGKVDWSYNSKQRSTSFALEFVEFEVKKSYTFEYSVTRYGYNSHGNYGAFYGRSNNNKTNINVYLGKIQINSSKSNTCENESEFVNFVLSEYLKTVITDSLKNSLDKKVKNELSLDKCN